MIRTQGPLEAIVAYKRQEVKCMRENIADPKVQQISALLNEERKHKCSTPLKQALLKKGLSIIAEIKRKSPSSGTMATIPDPVIQALYYQQGGASAISVLTDHQFFGGSIEDLEKIANMQRGCNNIPLLRKDFVIDPFQIAEAAFSGASAVLLIVAALGSATIDMLREADRMGLEALVEVHDRKELDIAIESGAKIVGVNNRNLKTFEVDMKTAETLCPLIPSNIAKVAESGIKSREEAYHLRDCGYDAVLIGEALVRSSDPVKFLKEIGDKE
jgi:indole-3-glycerol phosphate synthase